MTDRERIIEMINSNGGIQNRTIRKSTQMVMANCLLDDAKPQLTESTSYFMNGMNGQPETPTSTDGQNYLGITMPLIRRVFPALTIHHICGIQPMQGPVGKCYTVSAKANSSYTDRTKTPTVGYAANTAELGAGAVDWQYAGGTTGSLPTSAGENLGLAATMQSKKLTYKLQVLQSVRGTMKLKSQYTEELSDDFYNVHNVHLREEIIDILGAEIISEVDQFILQDIRSKATSANNYNWASPGTGAGRWEQELNVNLMGRINREASRIAQSSMMSAGNIIVASTGVCSVHLEL